MFTGIITDTAAIISSQKVENGLKLTFAKPSLWDDLQLGESIATNGVCLTVSEIRPTEYDCFLMPETLSVTSFGQHIPPTVNLERALRMSDRLGGHFVQGHVDGLGTVTTIDEGDGYRIIIQFSSQNKPMVIHKGSIAVNGVSLTVASCTDDTFSIALIPHTLEHTTLGTLTQGDSVNLEFDMIGKYVLKMSQDYCLVDLDTASEEKIVITPATPADARVIAHIQNVGWQATYPNAEYGITLEDIISKNFESEERVTKRVQRLLAEGETSQTWLAVVNKTVVGYSSAAKEDAIHKITSLYILPEYQGRGLGQKLMKQALEWLGNKKDISLGVVPYNQHAIKFYAHYGFELGKPIIHEKSTFPSGKNMPEVEMIRKAPFIAEL